MNQFSKWQRSDIPDPMRSGDERNLGELLGRYRNYLALIADAHLESAVKVRASVSDIVQETCLDATRAIRDFRGTTEAEFLGWLRAILINNIGHAIEFHVLAKKRSIRREVSLERLNGLTRSSIHLEQALVSQVESPSDAPKRGELIVQLADQLAKLSDDHRQVIMLRNLRGLKFHDVAKKMNRSESACRMLWLRAIEQMQKGLQEENLI